MEAVLEVWIAIGLVALWIGLSLLGALLGLLWQLCCFALKLVGIGHGPKHQDQ